MAKIRLALKRLPDTDEWRVSYLENGRLDDDKSYYTPDRADAVKTRAEMGRRLRAQGHEVTEAVIEKEAGDRPTDTPPSADRLKAYLDQVLLRVFCASPGLASYLESSRVVPEHGTVEMSFYKIPEEVISAVLQAFGIREVENLRYSKEGSDCIGFRAKPSREDLSSLAVDDADDHRFADPARDGEEENLTGVEAQANQLLKPPGQPAA